MYAVLAVFAVTLPPPSVLRLGAAQTALRRGRCVVAAEDAEDAQLSVSTLSRERAAALDVLTWNFVCIGDSTFEGRSVFGDGIAPVKPSQQDELSERLPSGFARYVFAGRGTVTAGGRTFTVKPNDLVEVRGGAADCRWTRGKGCGALVLGSSEYDSPARRYARAAIPYIFGTLALAAALVVVSGELS